MNDPRVQAKFKRSSHNNFCIFIISQDYYELPKRTIRDKETSLTHSNQIVSEMYKISIKKKQAWL